MQLQCIYFLSLDPKLYPIEMIKILFLDVLKKKKVLMVQGTGFNWHDQNHFRMVFLPNEDDLKIAISRFADYLTEFKKR